MNKKSRSKSSLFLMELIIVIMFFSLCAAICMRVFANAKVKTDYARNITNASFIAESAAEYFKEYGGSVSRMCKKFSVEPTDPYEIKVYYDKEWVVCNEANAEFLMTITIKEEPQIKRAMINIADNDGESLFSIVTATTEKTSGGGAAK